MTPKKTPAAVETTTSAQDSAILAEPHTGRKLNPTTTCSGNKPPRRNERRKARDRKRWPAKSCYIRVKPKGPVLKTPFGSAVAGPTVSGLLSRPEFSGDGFSQSRMVLGWMVANRKAPAWLIPCFDIQPTRRAQNAASGFKSRSGAKTMTTAVNLVRAAAPILSLPSRRAAPIQSAADTTNPQIIALYAAAENALASALHLLRSLDCDPAKLQVATGRACRAATLLKRASAAQEGGAA